MNAHFECLNRTLQEVLLNTEETLLVEDLRLFNKVCWIFIPTAIV